jgi:hypothetical protein
MEANDVLLASAVRAGKVGHERALAAFAESTRGERMSIRPIRTRSYETVRISIA